MGDGGKKVFVTVGTTSFDDLIRAIDTPECKAAILRRGYSSLLIQMGRGSYIPSQVSPYSIPRY
jgi:beta-1,4-N-acetylglucosaminyltransferase